MIKSDSNGVILSWETAQELDALLAKVANLGTYSDRMLAVAARAQVLRTAILTVVKEAQQ